MDWTARIGFTAPKKAELWERWKNGQCVVDIARGLGRRYKSSGYRILAHDGGILSMPGRRAVAALRLEERGEDAHGIATGRSILRIARDIGGSPSPVSQEIGRNSGSQAHRASQADRHAWEYSPPLRWRMTQKLALE